MTTKTITTFTLLPAILSIAHAGDSPSPVIETPLPQITKNESFLNRVGFENWRYNYSSTAEFYSWRESSGALKGEQLVLPQTFTIDFNGDISFGLKSAYIYSNNKSDTLGGQASTLSDTNLSFKHQKVHPNGKIQFLLDVNVPTGTASLDAEQRSSVMDSNLVGQVRYGEGWNFTPSVIYTHAFTKEFYAGIGAGYTYRGEYTPNAESGSPDFNPGNEMKLILNAQYAKNQYLVTGSANYIIYDTSELGGADYYEQGDRFDLNLTGFYQHSNGHLSSAYVHYIHSQKNDIFSPVNGKLISEDQNSNSDYYLVGVSHKRKLNSKWSVTGSLDWLHKTENGFNVETDQFTPQRDRFSVGIAGEYKIAQNQSLGLTTKYFWMEDKATPFTGNDVKYKGLNLLINYNIKF